MPESNCRCGWDGDGVHPCHRCHTRLGSTKFYLPTEKFSLAGAQLKFSMRETWACEECWEEFSELLRAAQRTKE